jgi:hypothetical protein
LEGEVDDVHHFIAEAKARGLSGFLKNPNDLLLLTKAVQIEWPTGRKDLFEKATAVVLKEVNPLHQRRHNFDADLLTDAAGWVSASLLLAGADDVAIDLSKLANASEEDLTRDRVETALRSRAFVTTVLGRVEPAHRTIAEFLAGQWLARIASTAIAETRIRSFLLSRDDAPPASLRGVFAWTVNFLPPIRVPNWLSVDPVGLVLQGDIGLLQSGQRNQLVTILASAAARDPSLGGWGTADERWGALVTSDTAATVAAQLELAATPDTLKIRLLDGAS